jgi:Na+/H+ antiporter NhaD/arsenite permease-like protein
MVVCHIYRNSFIRDRDKVSIETHQEWPAFNIWQSSKGIMAVIVLIILFFTDIPREISAIGIAGILLCSRKMKSRQIMHLVDWHLITLFFALFIIIQGVTVERIPDIIITTLNQRGIELRNTYMLTAISAIMSNLVSNVPATMLLIRFLEHGNPVQWYTLAVSSTFAGNLIVIGSIANLIVIEQAQNYGITIGFREHARVGVLTTLVSLLILIFWIMW